MIALREASDPARFGGKAVELGAALRAGLPVPDGLALSVELVDAIAAGDHATRDALGAAFVQLASPVAARSSAVGEDSQHASFAGQHATKLNVVSAAELIAAVCEVHESGHAAAALAYRSRAGVAGPPRMAIVVQRMVHADAAGVMFTRCPMSGRDERVIEAAWGLGEAVVSGLVSPDLFRIDRAGTIVERRVAHKEVMIVPRAGGGTEEVAVGARASQALSDPQLLALHELASRCERTFGHDGHDIEWAFSDATTLHLLQRRPITRKS